MCKQILSENPNIKTTITVSKISKAAGIANSTVYRVLHKYNTTRTVTSFHHCGGRPGVLKIVLEKECNSKMPWVSSFIPELKTLRTCDEYICNECYYTSFFKSNLTRNIKIHKGGNYAFDKLFVITQLQMIEQFLTDTAEITENNLDSYVYFLVTDLLLKIEIVSLKKQSIYNLHFKNGSVITKDQTHVNPG
ncbi:hypothetical protein FQA39_LY13062 [Lamprigera yunnana]|nr:hypothetical protein FQA39_LY13062 [Lamprigera yunnana]